MNLVLAAAAMFLAQPAPAHQGHHAAQPAPAPAPSTRWSVETTLISDIVANPAAKAIVERHLPGFGSHPMLGQAGRLTLRGVQGFVRGAITDAHLTAIQAEFAALPAA